LKKKILCSACLLGIKCKYDGNTNTNKKVLKLNEKEILIPVCPEQLGGLTTPRNPAELIGNSVITKTGTNVTDSFIKGAQQTLKTAQIFGCKKAILKQRSPSCGCGQIYDGTFSGKVIKGEGITAKLLRENGIEVISEEDID
jgi:uncharacterized protein YbbK (DUF523 family)